MTPRLLFARVMHKRLFPRVNAFSYRVYYLAFDIDRLDQLRDGFWFGVDSPGLASFRQSDHGPCDGSPLRPWADDILRQHGEGLDVQRIVLVAMPRTLGYGFNPVSFWLCLDGAERLRAVIAEVHNTFGERHVYFCRHEEGAPLTSSHRMEALKNFHVSPFLERTGYYSFRFDLRRGGFSVWIDYYAADGRKQLLTSLAGYFAPNTRRRRLAAFFTCPLVTIKTMAMIHWQALKLLFKGIMYIPRPVQLKERLVVSRKITKS
ncbi:MAG: DUF1365 domain-containing protein [Opitutales bacterium]|jgi:DUF1365 family protein